MISFYILLFLMVLVFFLYETSSKLESKKLFILALCLFLIHVELYALDWRTLEFWLLLVKNTIIMGILFARFLPPPQSLRSTTSPELSHFLLHPNSRVKKFWVLVITLFCFGLAYKWQIPNLLWAKYYGLLFASLLLSLCVPVFKTDWYSTLKILFAFEFVLALCELQIDPPSHFIDALIAAMTLLTGWTLQKLGHTFLDPNLPQEAKEQI